MNGTCNMFTGMLATEAGASGATIRNRTHKLEDFGVIRGNAVQVDFELVSGKLTNLYPCDVPVAERETLTHEARAISSVISTRTPMTNRRNLHILAVDESTGDLQHVTRPLTGVGIHTENEDLFEEEPFVSYGPFDPDDGGHTPEVDDFISLTGDTNVVGVPAQFGAPITSFTSEDVSKRRILDDETFVIAIKRGDREFTPRGNTVIESDDIVTALSRTGGDADADTLSAFRDPQTESSPG